MKTKIEIVRETVEYYKNNPRAVVGGRCVYFNESGCMCAFSRCCIDPALVEINHSGMPVQDFVDLRESYLKDEYRGHTSRFWERIQQLHDVEIYWDRNTLTKRGESFVAKLLELCQEELG